MNSAQRWVLFATAAVVVAMLLFPPFHFDVPGGYHRNEGYAFILHPPRVRAGVYATIHVAVLLAQIAAVTVIASALFLALRNFTPPPFPRKAFIRLGIGLGVLAFGLLLGAIIELVREQAETSFDGGASGPKPWERQWDELEPPLWKKAPLVEQPKLDSPGQGTPVK